MCYVSCVRVYDQEGEGEREIDSDARQIGVAALVRNRRCFKLRLRWDWGGIGECGGKI